MDYRPAVRRALGCRPQLWGVEIYGRLAIVFSAEDLSAGLVGQAVDGIVGYGPIAVKAGGRVRAGASEMMANLVLYCGKGGKR